MSCIKYPHTHVHTPPPTHTHTRMHTLTQVRSAFVLLCAGLAALGFPSRFRFQSGWASFWSPPWELLACERLWGPLCVIIQNPVNNTKRDANLLWRVRRGGRRRGEEREGVAREVASRTLCKYFKRTVTITAHPDCPLSPPGHMCVCVCALWRFSILSLLLALHFLQLLKIHTQIFRQHSHCPPVPIPGFPSSISLASFH